MATHGSIRSRSNRFVETLSCAALVLAAWFGTGASAESLVVPVAVRADRACCDSMPAQAIDNDAGTLWNSGRFAPAEIVIDLGRAFDLSRIELLAAQSPPGMTEHRISVSDDGASWTHVGSLRGETADGEWLSVPVRAAARYVAVATVESPSWVAWKEILIVQRAGKLPGYGFWDEGFNRAKFRTNYDSVDEGTDIDPLSIASCAFANCPSFPSTYSAGNAASGGLSDFSERQFWVLLNNNEPSFDNRCNSGPPDASLARSAPGEGLFGFAAIRDIVAGEAFIRAHLVLNANDPNPCLNGIPYMSVGAHSNRGNADAAGEPRLLGALNATPGVPHTVSFTTRLYHYSAMRAALYRLVAVASWPDQHGRALPRMIQLNLFYEGNKDSSPKGPATLRWSWPVVEDTFYPGAEVVYFDADDVEGLCGMHVRRLTTSDLDVDIRYQVDLDRLYRCGAQWGAWSNAMPTTTNIPITSVDWALEGQSTSGALWVAVHDMRMR